MKRLAPLVVFAFNRIEPLKRCISSLLKNDEAENTDLFVFVDGPRINRVEDKVNIEAVRQYVKEIRGFKSLSYRFSENNKGLGPSIIEGVSEVISRHGMAIVVEDDLILTPNFLSFMNKGLERFENEKKVFSVCGYTNKVRIPKNYTEDAYFCVRSSSWGWATWRDRWEQVDWDLLEWEKHRLNKYKFCKWGGSDCWKMLNDWHTGKNQSWAIRFCYSQFLNDTVSLFPITSKVANEGFDGNGTNCKGWSRFKCELDNGYSKNFKFPSTLSLNLKICKDSLSYHSLWRRIYSRIMYLVHS